MSLTRYVVIGLVIALGFSLGSADLSAALSGLRVAPESYKTVLKSGQSKQGYIDIANPSDTTESVSVHVQAFRYIGKDNAIQYYDDTHVAAGIIPDLKKFVVKSHETEHMAFRIDGAKLPSGDVFAALMFTANPNKSSTQSGSLTSVQLAVLFAITNRTPSSHHAKITDLSVPLLQFGDTIHGTYSVKNTANPKQSNGFFPRVTIAQRPFTSVAHHDSSLVFAGQTRSNAFDASTNRLGFYRVTVSYEGSSQSAWVFIVSPLPLVITFLLCLVLALFIWRFTAYRKKLRK